MLEFERIGWVGIVAIPGLLQHGLARSLQQSAKTGNGKGRARRRIVITLALELIERLTFQRHT